MSPRHGVRGDSEDLGGGKTISTTAPKGSQTSGWVAGGDTRPPKRPRGPRCPLQAVLTRCCWPGTGWGCRVWVPSAAQLQNLVPTSPGRGKRGLAGHRDDPTCAAGVPLSHISHNISTFPYPTATPGLGLPHTGSSWGWGAQAKGPSSAPFFGGPATSSLLRGGPRPSPGAAPGTRALQDALGVGMGSSSVPRCNMGSPWGGTNTPWGS